MNPDPHESFSIFAEVSIALAGFSGIIIAFGYRSFDTLSALELRRLANLFMLSGFVLVASLLAISVLHTTGIRNELFWGVASGTVFVMGTIWLVWDVYRVRSLAREGADINLLLVTIFDSLAAIALGLQLYNALFMCESWPVFVALTLITVGAFQQFILLVHMRLGERNGS